MSKGRIICDPPPPVMCSRPRPPGGRGSAPPAASSSPRGRAPGGRTAAPSASAPLPSPARRPRRPARTCGRTSGALSGRGPLEHVDQREVDLALFELDRGHLHLHAVAQAIDVPRVLALQQVGLLVEAVVVVSLGLH